MAHQPGLRALLKAGIASPDDVSTMLGELSRELSLSLPGGRLGLPDVDSVSWLHIPHCHVVRTVSLVQKAQQDASSTITTLLDSYDLSKGMQIQPFSTPLHTTPNLSGDSSASWASSAASLAVLQSALSQPSMLSAQGIDYVADHMKRSFSGAGLSQFASWSPRRAVPATVPLRLLAHSFHGILHGQPEGLSDAAGQLTHVGIQGPETTLVFQMPLPVQLHSVTVSFTAEPTDLQLSACAFPPDAPQTLQQDALPDSHVTQWAPCPGHTATLVFAAPVTTRLVQVTFKQPAWCNTGVFAVQLQALQAPTGVCCAPVRTLAGVLASFAVQAAANCAASQPGPLARLIQGLLHMCVATGSAACLQALCFACAYNPDCELPAGTVLALLEGILKASKVVGGGAAGTPTPPSVLAAVAPGHGSKITCLQLVDAVLLAVPSPVPASAGSSGHPAGTTEASQLHPLQGVTELPFLAEISPDSTALLQQLLAWANVTEDHSRVAGVLRWVGCLCHLLQTSKVPPSSVPLSGDVARACSKEAQVLAPGTRALVQLATDVACGTVAFCESLQPSEYTPARRLATSLLKLARDANGSSGDLPHVAEACRCLYLYGRGLSMLSSAAVADMLVGGSRGGAGGGLAGRLELASATQPLLVPSLQPLLDILADDSTSQLALAPPGVHMTSRAYLVQGGLRSNTHALLQALLAGPAPATRPPVRKALLLYTGRITQQALGLLASSGAEGGDGASVLGAGSVASGGGSQGARGALRRAAKRGTLAAARLPGQGGDGSADHFALLVALCDVIVLLAHSVRGAVTFKPDMHTPPPPGSPPLALAVGFVDAAADMLLVALHSARAFWRSPLLAATVGPSLTLLLSALRPSLLSGWSATATGTLQTATFGLRESALAAESALHDSVLQGSETVGGVPCSWPGGVASDHLLWYALYKSAHWLCSRSAAVLLSGPVPSHAEITAATWLQQEPFSAGLPAMLQGPGALLDSLMVTGNTFDGTAAGSGVPHDAELNHEWRVVHAAVEEHPRSDTCSDMDEGQAAFAQRLAKIWRGASLGADTSGDSQDAPWGQQVQWGAKLAEWACQGIKMSRIMRRKRPAAACDGSLFLALVKHAGPAVAAEVAGAISALQQGGEAALHAMQPSPAVLVLAGTVDYVRAKLHAVHGKQRGALAAAADAVSRRAIFTLHLSPAQAASPSSQEAAAQTLVHAVETAQACQGGDVTPENTCAVCKMVWGSMFSTAEFPESPPGTPLPTALQVPQQVFADHVAEFAQASADSVGEYCKEGLQEEHNLEQADMDPDATMAALLEEWASQEQSPWSACASPLEFARQLSALKRLQSSRNTAAQQDVRTTAGGASPVCPPVQLATAMQHAQLRETCRASGFALLQCALHCALAPDDAHSALKLVHPALGGAFWFVPMHSSVPLALQHTNGSSVATLLRMVEAGRTSEQQEGAAPRSGATTTRDTGAEVDPSAAGAAAAAAAGAGESKEEHDVGESKAEHGDEDGAAIASRPSAVYGAGFGESVRWSASVSDKPPRGHEEPNANPEHPHQDTKLAFMACLPLAYVLRVFRAAALAAFGGEQGTVPAALIVSGTQDTVFLEHTAHFLDADTVNLSGAGGDSSDSGSEEGGNDEETDLPALPSVAVGGASSDAFLLGAACSSATGSSPSAARGALSHVVALVSCVLSAVSSSAVPKEDDIAALGQLLGDALQLVNAEQVSGNCAGVQDAGVRALCSRLKTGSAGAIQLQHLVCSASGIEDHGRMRWLRRCLSGGVPFRCMPPEMGGSPLCVFQGTSAAMAAAVKSLRELPPLRQQTGFVLVKQLPSVEMLQGIAAAAADAEEHCALACVGALSVRGAGGLNPAQALLPLFRGWRDSSEQLHATAKAALVLLASGLWHPNPSSQPALHPDVVVACRLGGSDSPPPAHQVMGGQLCALLQPAVVQLTDSSSRPHAFLREPIETQNELQELLGRQLGLLATASHEVAAALVTADSMVVWQLCMAVPGACQLLALRCITLALGVLSPAAADAVLLKSAEAVGSFVQSHVAALCKRFADSPSNGVPSVLAPFPLPEHSAAGFVQWCFSLAGRNMCEVFPVASPEHALDVLPALSSECVDCCVHLASQDGWGDIVWHNAGTVVQAVMPAVSCSVSEEISALQFGPIQLAMQEHALERDALFQAVGALSVIGGGSWAGSVRLGASVLVPGGRVGTVLSTGPGLLGLVTAQSGFILGCDGTEAREATKLFPQHRLSIVGLNSARAGNIVVALRGQNTSAASNSGISRGTSFSRGESLRGGGSMRNTTSGVPGRSTSLVTMPGAGSGVQLVQVAEHCVSVQAAPPLSSVSSPPAHAALLSAVACALFVKLPPQDLSRGADAAGLLVAQELLGSVSQLRTLAVAALPGLLTHPAVTAASVPEDSSADTCGFSRAQLDSLQRKHVLDALLRVALEPLDGQGAAALGQLLRRRRALHAFMRREAGTLSTFWRQADLPDKLRGDLESAAGAVAVDVALRSIAADGESKQSAGASPAHRDLKRTASGSFTVGSPFSTRASSMALENGLPEEMCEGVLTMCGGDVKAASQWCQAFGAEYAQHYEHRAAAGGIKREQSSRIGTEFALSSAMQSSGGGSPASSRGGASAGAGAVPSSEPSALQQGAAALEFVTAADNGDDGRGGGAREDAPTFEGADPSTSAAMVAATRLGEVASRLGLLHGHVRWVGTSVAVAHTDANTQAAQAAGTPPPVPGALALYGPTHQHIWFPQAGPSADTALSCTLLSGGGDIMHGGGWLQLVTCDAGLSLAAPCDLRMSGSEPSGPRLAPVRDRDLQAWGGGGGGGPPPAGQMTRLFHVHAVGGAIITAPAGAPAAAAVVDSALSTQLARLSLQNTLQALSLDEWIDLAMEQSSGAHSGMARLLLLLRLASASAQSEQAARGAGTDSMRVGEHSSGDLESKSPASAALMSDDTIVRVPASVQFAPGGGIRQEASAAASFARLLQHVLQQETLMMQRAGQTDTSSGAASSAQVQAALAKVQAAREAEAARAAALQARREAALEQARRAYSEEEWPCSRCTFLNEPGEEACAVCMGDRPPFDPAQVQVNLQLQQEESLEVTQESPAAVASTLGPVTKALVTECTTHIIKAANSSTAPVGPPRVIESLHPLPKTCNFTMKHSFPGASYICVVFDPKCSLPGLPGAEQALPEQDRALPSRHGLQGMPAWLALAGKNGLMRCAGEPEQYGTSGRYVYGYHFDRAAAGGGALQTLVVQSDTIAITSSCQPPNRNTGGDASAPWSEHWGWRITLVPMGAVTWKTEHQVLHSHSFAFGLWLLRFLSSGRGVLADSGLLHRADIFRATTQYLCTPGVPHKQQIVPMLAGLLMEPHLFLAGSVPPATVLANLQLGATATIIYRSANRELGRQQRSSGGGGSGAVPDRVLLLIQLSALMNRANSLLQAAAARGWSAADAELSPPAPRSRARVRLLPAPFSIPVYEAPSFMDRIEAVYDTCAAFAYGRSVPSHVLCHAIVLCQCLPGSVLQKPNRAAWPFTVADEQNAALEMTKFKPEHDAAVVGWMQDCARSRECPEVTLNVSALVLSSAAREKYPVLGMFSSGTLKLRAALVLILNHRVAHAIQLLDSQGAASEGTAAAEASSGASNGIHSTAGRTPLAVSSPLIPASTVEEHIDRLLHALGAGAAPPATNTGAWTLGTQVRAVSHLLFSSSKLPILEEGIQSMTAPESARNTSNVLIHAGRARTAKEQEQHHPRTAKTIFTQLAARLREMCKMRKRFTPEGGAGYGLGMSDTELFGLEGSSAPSTQTMQRCLEPLRVKPHERKQNVFFVKFQDFDSLGRTVETQGLDWGGLFRECLTLAASELCQPDILSLFIEAKNASARLGQGGTFVPNPALTSLQDLAMFEMVGVLIGIFVRLKSPQELPLSGIVWKLILGTPPTLDDLEACDEPFVAALKARLRTVATGSKAEIAELAGASAWEAISIDGARVPLDAPPSDVTPGGGVAPTRQALKSHATRLLGYRLREMEPAAAAIRRGLGGMVPMSALRIFTPAEFAYLVQGESTVDLGRLRAHTTYAGEYSEQHPIVKRFWRVVGAFSEEQKVELVRFSWGRSRLPPPGQWPSNLKFKLGQWRKTGQAADSMLPIAATCSFALYIPAYSSDAIMQERLQLALAGTEYGTFDRA